MTSKDIWHTKKLDGIRALGVSGSPIRVVLSCCKKILGTMGPLGVTLAGNLANGRSRFGDR